MKTPEWPTWLVAISIHLGWLAATAWFHALPWPARALIGGWLVAWHGSLQHEAIHGHPTTRSRINSLVAGAPLSLWLPYGRYRRSHLAHHRSAAITDPFGDPESRYRAAGPGVAAALGRAAAALQSTLAGRMLIGPPLVVTAFLLGEVRGLLADRAAMLRDWLPHLAGVAAILGWLRLCGVPVTGYIACFVYPGLSLTLLRSYAEHRAAAVPGHRIAIVEHGGAFALLFLNNNLHAAHHAAPRLPWYRLPAYHRRHRARLVRDNGGLLYSGYGEIARRFLLRAHDDVIHPDHRMPA